MTGSCLVALAVFFAGSPVDAAPRAAPAPRAEPAPAELLATVTIGPVTTLRGLQAYLEAVTPGAGAGLNDRVLRRAIAEVIGVSSLDGIDPASWMYLLVVSTVDTPSIGLLARVADAQVLAASAGGKLVIKGGWAVIGGKPVIERAGGFAFATLAAQPTPTAPSATVYFAHVLSRYRNEIDVVRRQVAAAVVQAGSSDGMMRMMGGFADDVYAELGDVEQVDVTVEATPELAAIDLALAPRPKSRFASFVAVQRPSDYGLLGKLPAAPRAAGVVAGHIEAGPYHDGLVAMSAAIYGTGIDEIRTTVGALLKACTGDIAMVLQMSPDTGMSAGQLLGVSDTAAANRAIAGMLDLFKSGRTVDSNQISTTLTTLPDAPSHEGVVLRGYRTTYDLSKAPPAQRKAIERIARAGGTDTRIAAFDKVGTVVAGPDALADAGRVIDAARGKAARFVPSPTLAGFLADSRARKDSMVMTFDVTGLIAVAAGAHPQDGPEAPFLVSLRFADRRAHLRIAAPVASVRAAAAAGKP
jgi:hypothetical protein